MNGGRATGIVNLLLAMRLIHFFSLASASALLTRQADWVSHACRADPVSPVIQSNRNAHPVRTARPGERQGGIGSEVGTSGSEGEMKS